MTFDFRRLGFVCSALGLLSITMLAGCAGGLFWQSGKYSPWARSKWEAEEQIADTLFEKKRRMNNAVSAALAGPPEAKSQAAQMLAETLRNERILLIRMHAVNLMGQLHCPETVNTLQEALSDSNSDVRIAAVNALSHFPAEDAVPNLQEAIGSDTHVDVRMAATRALGNFTGEQTVRALAVALDDPNPALQLRATESLRHATGENLGRNVGAWQKYVQQMLPDHNPIRTDRLENPLESNSRTRVASQPDKSTFR